MDMPTNKQKNALERELITTIRKLQPQRAWQVLDFARWLQTQPIRDGLPGEEITAEELEVEEQAWETFYLANQAEFREMAQQAINDLESGDTLEMVIENGKITAR